MKRYLGFTPEAVADVAGGAVVAVPTDTVYGVGASLSHPASVRRLFTLKVRPITIALPVLVGRVPQIESLGVDLDDRARRLADRFWPGALTIVVPAPLHLAALVGGIDSVGFRVPGDIELRSFLERVGPLALTSANRHGDAPCHLADDVATTFPEASGLDGIIDGGRRDGAVSTVLELNDRWTLRREGAIPLEDLAAILDIPS